MFAESIPGKLVALFAIFIKYYNNSHTKKAVNDFAVKFKNVFIGGFIYRFLISDDKIGGFTRQSGILKSLDIISSAFITFFGRIYKKFARVNESSLNRAFYSLLKADGRLRYENVMGMFFLFMVIVPDAYWNNSYAVLGAFALAALYIAALFTGRHFSYRISRFDITLTIFMFSAFAAVFISHAIKDSLRIFMFFLTSFIFMMCIAGSIKKIERFHIFIGFIFTGVAITSIYCIYQGITGVSVDVRLTDTFFNVGMPGRAYSTFGNPNNYGEYLVMFFPFLAAFALNSKNKRMKWVYFICLLLPVAALIYTYSRSCWVSIAICIFVFAALYNWRLIPALILAGIIAIPFLPASVMNRILSIGNLSDTSNEYRLFIWRGTLRMLSDYWAQGIGLGPDTFAKIYRNYADSNAILAPHSHMLYLQVIAEMGIVGFLSFFAHWFMTIKRSIGILIVKRVSMEARNYVIAGISSLTGLIFVCGVEYIWFYPRVMFCFFIVLGAIMAIINICKEEQKL